MHRGRGHVAVAPLGAFDPPPPPPRHPWMGEKKNASPRTLRTVSKRFPCLALISKEVFQTNKPTIKHATKRRSCVPPPKIVGIEPTANSAAGGVTGGRVQAFDSGGGHVSIDETAAKR